MTFLTQESDRCRPAVLVNTLNATTQTLEAFGDCVRGLALDPSGTVAATGDSAGVVRVGRLDEDPHLLMGHEGRIRNLAISPNLKWVASAVEDHALRLWPMPDLDERTLHTLASDDLLAKLKSLTNLRAVRDPESGTGWKIEVGPFPGWKEIPEW